MDGATPGQQLSQADIGLVLCRAADLDRSNDSSDRLDEAAVEAAALEAGLSRASVCQALAELRAGTLRPGGGPTQGLLGPSTLVVRRLVPGPLEAVRRSVDGFLGGQLFELQRDLGEVTRWARRDGLLPSLRRSLDLNHRLTLSGVRRLDLALAPDQGHDGGRVMVSLVADVAEQRRAHAWLLGGGAAAGAGVVGATAATVGLEPLLVMTLPVSAGFVVGSHRWGLARYRDEVGRIETALAGLLDRLERRPAVATNRITAPQ